MRKPEGPANGMYAALAVAAALGTGCVQKEMSSRVQDCMDELRAKTGILRVLAVGTGDAVVKTVKQLPEGGQDSTLCRPDCTITPQATATAETPMVLIDCK